MKMEYNHLKLLTILQDILKTYKFHKQKVSTKKSKFALQKTLQMSNGKKNYKDFIENKIHYNNFMNFF